MPPTTTRTISGIPSAAHTERGTAGPAGVAARGMGVVTADDRATWATTRSALTACCGPDIRPTVSAFDTWPAFSNRSAGFLAMHRTITSDSHCGIFAFTDVARGGAWVMC